MNHSLAHACFYIFIAVVAVMLAFASAPAFNTADDGREAMNAVPSLLQTVLFQTESGDIGSTPRLEHTSVKAVLSR